MNAWNGSPAVEALMYVPVGFIASVLEKARFLSESD